MTIRERYINTLTFKTPDKVFLTPGHPRMSTIKRWEAEGLPPDVNYLEYLSDKFNLQTDWNQNFDLFINFRMIPTFEEKVLEHKNGHYIVQDWMGAITEISDNYDYTYIRNAIDFVTRKWHKFPVETREDWQEMKKRYNAFDPGRVPGDMARIAKETHTTDKIVSISVNGPFWQLREWMGFENLCIAFLDDPELVKEMIDFWCEFVLKVLSGFIADIKPDRFFISEDMAYKAHSMISPAMTREFLLPVYKKWITLLKRHGCPIIDMDSDGYIGDLIPIWVDAGINVNDPVEVAAHNDIVKYRDVYGEKMAFTGGIDKRAIAAGGRDLRNEMERVIPPLLKKGGYIPGCDHGVPHDISFRNFTEYFELLCKMTGWL